MIFFQFHPSIFDFIIFLYQFGSCSLDCYLFYFEYFFNVNSLFHFHPSIFYWSGFCWLEIWLFGFAFYEIIPTLEPGSWVWNVNSSWLKFFFMIDFFLISSFYTGFFEHWSLLFSFSMGLSWFHVLGREFGEVTQVDSS